MHGSDSTIITIFIVSALIVLVLVVMIVLFTLLYQRKVMQQRMSVQDLEVHFQKELLAATLQSQEVERSRIARDLHDSVGVMLSTLQLTLRHYGGQDQSDPKRREMVAQASEIITGTIATVRRISHNLLPPELEMLGLQAAMERLIGEINESGGLRVDLEFSRMKSRLPVRSEMLLFRIVHELLNNTIKHSGASEVKIIYVEHGREGELRYSDNGKGIPEHLFNKPFRDEKEEWGIGLSNIESRARSLGGRMQWESGIGSGMACALKFNLPITSMELS